MSQSEEYVTIRHAIEQLIDANTALRRENRLLVTRVEELSDAHNLATDEITRLRAALRQIVDHGDTGEGGRPAFHAMRTIARAALSGREETEAERAAWADLRANTGAEPRPYLIQHISLVDEETREPLFWNDDIGYGHRATAAHFTAAQRATMILPTGGIWLLTEGFHGDGCGPTEVKP